MEICKAHTDLKDSDPLTKNLSHKQNMIKPENSLSLNHMMMWTSLMTLVNSLDVGHMEMWPVSVNHYVIVMNPTPMGFDHVACKKGFFSQRVWTFQSRVCFTNLYVIS